MNFAYSLAGFSFLKCFNAGCFERNTSKDSSSFVISQGFIYLQINPIILLHLIHQLNFHKQLLNHEFNCRISKFVFQLSNIINFVS